MRVKDRWLGERPADSAESAGCWPVTAGGGDSTDHLGDPGAVGRLWCPGRPGRLAGKAAGLSGAHVHYVNRLPLIELRLVGQHDGTDTRSLMEDLSELQSGHVHRAGLSGQGADV